MEIGSIQGSNSTLNAYTKAEQTNNTENTKNKDDDGQAKKSTDVINANDLNLGGQQENTLKELLAKKAALKVQMDQFAKDLKIDDKIDGYEEKNETKLNEAGANQGEVDRLNSLKEDLKNTYCIEDDSQEQKDLELLEKVAAKKDLTEDDIKRLAYLGPVTDYQKSALEYDKMIEVFTKRAEDSRKEAVNAKSTIIGIKLGLLKSAPMQEAKEEAEDILKTIDDEIQKAILEELKNKVNENLDIDPNEQILDNPQALLEKKKLTEEDLKGLAVDEKV